MDLLKLLFILSILLFPFGEVIRVSAVGLSVKLIDIGVVALAFYWILFSIKNLKEVKIDKILGIPILIFSVVSLLSLIFNAGFLNTNELLVSSLYLIRWIAYASIIFIIHGFDNSFKKKIIKLLIFIGFVIVLFGYIQYFFYPNLRNLYYLGWDEHLYRMFSVFLDPNFAGVFFVLYFLFILENLLNNLKKNNKLLPLFFGVIGLLTLLAIFLTYSRSALLALLAGACLFPLLKRKITQLGLIVIIFICFIFFAPKLFQSEGTNLFRTVSAKARVESYREALDVFSHSPIIGSGFNTYKYTRERYGYLNKSKYINHAEFGTDNSFLFVLATTGVMGFTAYLYIWFKIIKVNIKSKFLISSIIAIFIDSLFVNSLFYSFLMFWTWTLVGLYGE